MNYTSNSTLRKQVCSRIIELWFARKDTYARAYLLSTGEMSYAPSCAHSPTCVRGSKCPYYRPQKITEDIVYSHISAPAHTPTRTIGTYSLGPDNLCHWICFDIDGHDGGLEDAMKVIRQVTATLYGLSIPYYVEDSGNGFHIWVFCLGMEAKVAHFAGKFIVQKTIDSSGKDSLIKPVEIFPKQYNTSAFGNLVKLPLGRHKSGKKCLFVDTMNNFRPFDNQYTDVLLGIKCANEEVLMELAEEYLLKHKRQFSSLDMKKDWDIYAGPPCTQLMFQARLREGNRNNILFQLAINLRRAGFFAMETVKDILWEWNKKNIEPLGSVEFERTVNHAFESNYSWGCSREYIGPYCLRSQCPVGIAIEAKEIERLNAELLRFTGKNTYRRELY